MVDNFDLQFRQVQTAEVDEFHLSFYLLNQEQVFRVSFADASGRDPLPTALLDRLSARKLAGHNVNCYKYPPMIAEKTIPIALEDYPKTVPGKMIWIRDEYDPLFRMGRWAQIQGRTFTSQAQSVRLRVRISDHPEAFLEPS